MPVSGYVYGGTKHDAPPRLGDLEQVNAAIMATRTEWDNRRLGACGECGRRVACYQTKDNAQCAARKARKGMVPVQCGLYWHLTGAAA